jgi:putative flippase GtrA
MSRFTSAVSSRFGTFLRYGAGSLVAMACSEVVLVGAYAVAGAGALLATVLAWTAGAVPNYVLNRRWAWRVEGDGDGDRDESRDGDGDGDGGEDGWVRGSQPQPRPQSRLQPQSRPKPRSLVRSAERRRELALYWGITFCMATAAVGATALMDAWIKGAVPERGMQSLLLAAAYLLAYGVVFVTKFVLFDTVVFGSRRSRHHVPSTTRA